MFLSVIGTSKIIENHLKSAKKNKFILHSIATTRGKNSNNLKKIYKDYSFKKKFFNWKDLYDSTKNIDNMVYLISPRIKETFKISSYFLKYKKKIIVEKPLSTQMKNFKTLKNFKQNIFVGYNRVYYDNVQYLKKENLSKSIVNVNCIESNKKTFAENSCHIVSILLYLFSDLKILYKAENKKNIFCRLYSNKNKSTINLNIYYNIPKNFNIEIIRDKKIFELKPIERLKTFTKLSIKKKRNILKVTPQVDINSYENSNNSSKPGFDNQWQHFRKFIFSKKCITDIDFAEKVMRLCLDIIGKK